VYFGRIHFDESISRDTTIRDVYTESIVDYISVIFVAEGSQEALEMETPLSTGGPECHSRMTQRPLPATSSIVVLVVVDVVVVINNASSTSAPRRPMTYARIRMQISRDVSRNLSAVTLCATTVSALHN